MSPTAAKLLIDQIAKLDLIATQLAGPIGELNRDGVLTWEALSALGSVQAHISSLRRAVHAAGALDAIRQAA